MDTQQLLKGWAEFKNIPAGSHFEDKDGRKFIKLVNKTAIGIPQKFGRIVEASTYGPQSSFLAFNAVDYDGYVGNCPDWVPFKVIKKPRHH
jgi:hypothetical protein